MSMFEPRPFGEAATFADNPEPRCPCVLLLDTSGSMAGEKIRKLNEGLQTFRSELQLDSMAAKRVEVALVGFGPVTTLQPFVTADSFDPPELAAMGDTPMGAAILQAVEMVRSRKDQYKSNGIAYYRPWIFLITDGSPTDDVTAAAAAIRHGESSKSLMFFAVGVDDADMSRLQAISVRAPVHLNGLSFREMFQWLSSSLGSVSRSSVGTAVPLAPPTGWSSTE